MAERKIRMVKPDVLRDLMERMLRAAGCEAEAAATAAGDCDEKSERQPPIAASACAGSASSVKSRLPAET